MCTKRIKAYNRHTVLIAQNNSENSSFSAFPSHGANPANHTMERIRTPMELVQLNRIIENKEQQQKKKTTTKTGDTRNIANWLQLNNKEIFTDPFRSTVFIRISWDTLGVVFRQQPTPYVVTLNKEQECTIHPIEFKCPLKFRPRIARRRVCLIVKSCELILTLANLSCLNNACKGLVNRHAGHRASRCHTRSKPH